ncbi:MAG TPA: hypothetical protein VOA64_00945 [Candidatus Dormibacteraeota bacterium]|nr:hypothetical protein [Candidatus Dormibacteraeota bacterium]
MSESRNPVYIQPTLHVHSTLAEAKTFSDEFGPYYFWSEKTRVDISDIAQGKRNLIIGEPGVGKTLLMVKLDEFLNANGTPTCLIHLKHQNSINLIEQFLGNNEAASDLGLLLDGLDEVQGSLFPSVLEKIEDVSRTRSGITICVSSRSIFANRYTTSFPEYRVITISPFTYDQVKEYLIAGGHDDSEVGAFLDRVMSFSHNMLVIQIPRYLSLLNEFLAKKQINSVKHLSRNELFEYFIYAKLDLEDKRLNAGNVAITKRLLEKLALTMEVYQANSISKDELMTFLDDLESDLKLAALSQLDLQELFDKSLLKDNLDSIEFDNTEFQEYLAAKEITRFSDPRFAAFNFAVERNINEIHPSWFNALTFLVDMQPDLVEQLIEFSGIRGSKIVDEGFVNFLSRINPNSIGTRLKNTLFKDLVEYHHRHFQWIPARLASSLPGLFGAHQEPLLKSEVANAELQVSQKRFVPLGNIALVVGYLLEAETNLDRPYWRKKLLEFAADDNDNGVLQRHALLALEKLKEPSVVHDLSPTLMQKDELIVRAFLRLCTTIAPENPASMGYFFEATRRGEIHGRYGLYALKGKDALKIFLATFIADSAFRQAFLDKSSIFKDQDRVIVEHIKAVWDQDMAALCERAILLSFHFDVAHDAERSAFVLGLGRLLKAEVTDFLPVIIEQIRESHLPSGFFFTRSLFVAILDERDVPQYLAAMIAAGEQVAALGIMFTIKVSNRPEAQTIFEAGRPILRHQYEEWENERAASGPHKVAYEQKVLDEFKKHLEPAPGEYSKGVFAFYLDHVTELDPIISPEDKNRLVILTGSVFRNINPADYDLTATALHAGYVTSYNVSTNISLFGDALRVAELLVIDLAEFRQRIINFIPFAYAEHLRAIFKLIKNITPHELAPVVDIYKQHKSDLWRHMPSNLIDAIERYHVTEAAPVLRTFVKESVFPSQVRQSALTVAESFVADKQFLKEVVTAYENSTDQNDAAVAVTALDMLITAHSDPTAIRQKLHLIIEGAAPFTQSRGVHAVGPLEHEIISDKPFARPLMKLKTRGFEQDYLQLLDCAASLWSKGKDFYAYATYLWDVVYAYFDNLKEHGSYEPLQALEKKLATIKYKEGSNWLAARISQLRRAYLAYLGKPQNIAEAIRRYNSARHHDNKKIVNSEDLIHQVKEVFETDLTQWIQAEGAYDLLLTGKVYKTKIQQYEKLVQKTLKSQIEILLLKRGFQIEILREPQLLDEKRTDLLIRYGFAGPVIVEVKLTSNTDMRIAKPEKSASFTSMKQYMKGYGASHGIFIVIDNHGARNLERIQKAFGEIPNVWVKVFDYRGDNKPGKTSPKAPSGRRRGRRKVI